jgi:hypothetical protein
MGGQLDDDQWDTYCGVERAEVLKNVKNLIDLFTTPTLDNPDLTPRQIPHNRLCNNMEQWEEVKERFLLEANFGFLFFDTESQWRRDKQDDFTIMWTLTTVLGLTLHIDLRRWIRDAQAPKTTRAHQVLPEELIALFQPQQDESEAVIFIGNAIEADFKDAFPWKMNRERLMEAQVLFDGMVQRGK